MRPSITSSAGAASTSDDPLGRATIARLVPDIADQDVYLCGPADLMRAVEAALRELGVPASKVHAERFAY